MFQATLSGIASNNNPKKTKWNMINPLVEYANCSYHCISEKWDHQPVWMLAFSGEIHGMITKKKMLSDVMSWARCKSRDQGG